MKNKYSVILGNLGNTCDRFLPTGYKDKLPKEEMIRQAAAIPGIEGLELVGTWDITKDNVKVMKRLLSDHGLKCVSIIPDLFSQKRWGGGSFAAKSAAIRRQAYEETCVVSELAEVMGCSLINLWLGQDGYDYPMQSHYLRERQWMVEGLVKVAERFPRLRYALEYKPKEPRTHSFQARMADTLLMALDTGWSYSYTYINLVPSRSSSTYRNWSFNHSNTTNRRSTVYLSICLSNLQCRLVYM